MHLASSADKPKLLLHTCCLPCLFYPYEMLTKDGWDVDVFWYNPNIYPYQELMNRFFCLKDWCNKNSIKLLVERSIPEDFYRAIFIRNRNFSRCDACWHLRLKRTIEVALANNYDAFCSTLLVSKYQDPVRINEIGKDLSDEFGVKYIEADFRDGFDYAHKKAKELGVYLQKWCGCLFSFSMRKRAILRRKMRKNLRKAGDEL